ncbi:MAG: hypothetical protein GTO16_05050 [Candidatus Aminicenantes bacterium]|nr:hypothetical protein [Candidatus Aminicenantes bacterium]NIM58296.1 hypothetical protein [Candidatus Aminicenantes bacterium]
MNFENRGVWNCLGALTWNGAVFSSCPPTRPELNYLFLLLLTYTTDLSRASFSFYLVAITGTRCKIGSEHREPVMAISLSYLSALASTVTSGKA